MSTMASNDHLADRGRALAAFVFGVLSESVSDGAFVVLRSGRTVVSVNQRGEDLLGRRADDLLGRPVDELFAEGDLRGGAAIVDHPGRYEDIALVQVDGYPLYVELTVAHVEHPQLGPLAACLARDTTERRALERDLLAKHTALFAAHAELEQIGRASCRERV